MSGKRASSKKGGVHKRNPQIAKGIERFGRHAAAHNKGGYKVKNKKTTVKVAAKDVAKVQQVGGAGNGGSRTIEKKSPRWYAAEDTPHKLNHHKKARAAKLRASLVPGAVLILLAGRFVGKRVVYLGQLPSGLLLVTGPFKINGVPLRRVNQAYVIATSTVVNVSSVKVPAHVNDAYFRRPKAEKKAKNEELFAAAEKKEKNVIKASRVADQKAVDSQVLTVIQKNSVLAKYLKAKFTLTRGQYPHRLRF